MHPGYNDMFCNRIPRFHHEEGDNGSETCRETLRHVLVRLRSAPVPQHRPNTQDVQSTAYGGMVEDPLLSESLPRANAFEIHDVNAIPASGNLKFLHAAFDCCESAGGMDTGTESPSGTGCGGNIGSLSNQLKQEILVNTYGTLLTNTIILKDIPYALLVRISSMMKMEIYLPNDVVVVADTDSEIMYFIQTGMVAVYDKCDREVYHLADRSYFGEISLFTDEEKRSASVTAIAPYPDIYDKIKKLARVKDFLAEKERHGYIKDYAAIAKKDSTRESKTKVYCNV
ncbi:hypothetical protein Trydic_g3687 [Trypoxylus dichotomus]